MAQVHQHFRFEYESRFHLETACRKLLSAYKDLSNLDIRDQELLRKVAARLRMLAATVDGIAELREPESR